MGSSSFSWSQLYIRLALLDALLVLSPVGLVLWVLPQTGSWATWWLRAFLVTVFQQAVQVVVLTLGTLFLLRDPQSLTVSQVLLHLPVAIAIVYLATRVPSILERNTGVSASMGWFQTVGMAFFAWRVMRSLPDLGTSRLASQVRGAGGSGGGGASAGGPGWTPPSGPGPLQGPPLQGVLAATRVTQIESTPLRALPATTGSGTGSLADDSRYPRMLLDLPTHGQGRTGGDA